ncbi:MAG TPA: sensor histidine kinase [Vicinamibacterales bacterium]|nr:sensor histidine kinase [Vicinamibacterales bacterium]
MTTSTAAPIPQPASLEAGPLFSGGVVASTWFAFIHLLLNLPLGIVYFTVLLTSVSLGTGLLITLIGIPILIATGWMVRTLGNIERARMNMFLGTTLRDPYRHAVPEAGWIARLAAIGNDPATWRDFVFLMLRLPLGIFTFTVSVTTWAVAGGLLSSPIAYWFGVFRMQFGSWVFDGPVAMMIATLAGIPMTLLAFGVTRGLARLEAVMGAALLDASPDELRRRVADIAKSRTRSMSAADEERRRLERDLHDGAQQRIVSLAMTLGLAQQKLASNPEQGARLVAEAHEEAKRALQDLRDLARGLHPAVLTDHGLEAALPALAARCPIPTRVDVAVSPRPAPAVESAAYFVVAEALTNVARHSQAANVQVAARRVHDLLTVEVRDDGKGGASVVPGGGLAGLTDRVEALEGRLHVTSPEGGPTVLHVEMPCG